VQRLLAREVITPRGAIGPASVVIDGERIIGVERVTGPVPDRTLTPGFIDLQVNGIDDVDVAHASTVGDWDRLDAALLAQGVTTWCPTLVTAPLDAFGAPLDRIAARALEHDGPRPRIAGAHLEGPFLGGAPGAHPKHLIRSPDLDWLSALPDIVRLVTLAPEQPGAIEAIELLTRRDIVVSLGHSTASYEQAIAAIDAGATLVTHTFNGMGPLHHREPGLVGAALSDDRVAACVIADLVHLHPAAITTVLRAKGMERAVLVTDAVAWRAGRVGEEVRMRFDPADVRGAAPRLADGTLAGSALTMDVAIRNVVAQCGASITDAVAAASTVPARVLGLHDRGAIEAGRRADLVALDADLRVESVWIGGVAAQVPRQVTFGG
jgi:N-acetylglucosamine-6-phosphate deacetylase